MPSESSAGPSNVAASSFERVLSTLACPECRNRLSLSGTSLACRTCARSFGIVDTVADLRLDPQYTNDQLREWADHWTPTRSPLEHLLSVYRKNIGARSVRNACARYFPTSGVFVEAGSGTAETSCRIDKHNGRRTLVALDFVPAVLRATHAIVDVRVAGDLFRLPFADDSLDGVFNVGVLEHYTHAEVDTALQEFRRVLRPGGRVIIFWPATNSLPQKVLVAGAVTVGLLTGRGAGYRFHPPEISQLHSDQEGRDFLDRNGFRPIAVTGGLEGYIAWKTVVGEKAL